jgi:hypothetical protein
MHANVVLCCNEINQQCRARRESIENRQKKKIESESVRACWKCQQVSRDAKWSSQAKWVTVRRYENEAQETNANSDTVPV